MAGRPKNELGQPTILPKHFTFSNFTTLWSGGGLGGSIGTSLEIAAGATVIVLLVALPAAYCTARRRFRGRGAFLLLVLATQMFQPAAMLVGVQREFTNFGIPPTLSLIIVNAGFNLAFAVWILNAFFSSIPVELEEASHGRRPRPGRRAAADHPAAGRAGHRHRAHLHLHLGVERVPGRAHAQPRAAAAQQPLTVAINEFIGEYSVDWGHLFAAAWSRPCP